ncbi:MAG: glycoside hydrolase [Kiritimatiellaeota bacterium]|nr:glycoside hydrolase [Kiritimatiellota bacterium]
MVEKTEFNTQKKKFNDGRDWFFEKRFGMFIHWGIYSIPGWHEQMQWRMEVPRLEYAKLAEKFNPTRFNPDEWLDAAESAGMEYVTFTAKHHDGFCLWNTKETDYNVMNSPYGEDVLAKLADACHKRFMPLCVYYSVPDWYHKNYPNQGRHHELEPQKGDDPDIGKYVTFVKAQLREICSNYGEIHGIWWDNNVPEHDDPSVNAMIRKLQPKAIINNRGFDDGDFATPEREMRDAHGDVNSPTTPVEACDSIGAESWGYRENEDYYSIGRLTNKIDYYLARGHNYLLNLGPKGDGSIPEKASAILAEIGRWYGNVKESFQGTEFVVSEDADVDITRKGDILYAHLNEKRDKSGVIIQGVDKSPKSAIVMNNGNKLETAVELMPSKFQSEPCLHIWGIPIDELSNEAIVLKLS